MSGEAGVVVVTYNSADVIGACLDRCCHLKTVVVDNGSTDQTLDEVRRRPRVRLIANGYNLGFGSAVNQGVRELDREYILILNPDVQLQTTIDPLVDACRRPGTAIASGQLLNAEGEPQRGFTVRRLPTPAALAFEVLGINRLFPRNPVNRSYRCFDFDLNQTADVEQPAGAFLLFRRDLWDRLGGFDPRFHPLWFEDVDFCKRTLDAGLKIRYVPEVKAKHQGGNSIAKLSWGCREVYWYVSLLRYASKHFEPGAFRGVSVAVVLGSVLRAMIGVVGGRHGEVRSVYAKIVRLAFVCAVRGQIPEPLPESGSGEKAVG